MRDPHYAPWAEALLTSSRGNRYVLSEHGNSQVSIPNRPLFIPGYRLGGASSVLQGKEIVFGLETGETFCGLHHSLLDESFGVPLVITDNHNSVAHAWGLAWKYGLLSSAVCCLHIDQHSDLWSNPAGTTYLQRSDPDWWEYAHQFCNVGNYIQPLRSLGYISDVVRIEGECDLEKIEVPTQYERGYILNIDLDFWAQDLDYIPRSRSMPLVRNLFENAGLITIAFSPSFIPHDRAMDALRELISLKREC